MDTSISKALIMIAGVLLAMLVIAFATKTFIQMGGWATTQDQEQLTEQVQKFNKEYEAYDKDLMYGVDVISCLNKAKSNNDKIIDTDYEIQVTVKLKPSSTGKAELSESLTVYHIISTGNGKETAYTNGNGPSEDIKLGDLNFKFLNTNYINLLGSKFTKDFVIKTDEDSKVKVANPLELTKNSTSNDDIIKLLDSSDAVSQTVKNTDNASKNDVNGWTKVEFKSALYDLKLRKFKCEGIEYDSSTGRAKKITFKEI